MKKVIVHTKNTESLYLTTGKEYDVIEEGQDFLYGSGKYVKLKNDNGEIVGYDSSHFIKNNQVDHPDHYGGKYNPYEAIKVIEAWKLGFNLGNSVKYISRAGKKNPSVDGLVQDLEKAKWYLEREINNLKK